MRRLSTVLILCVLASSAEANRSSFRVAGECKVEGKGKAAELVVSVAYANPGASGRKDNRACFFVHERPPFTINTGGGRDTGLEVAEGKPIGELEMPRDTGMGTLRGKVSALGVKPGKTYYLAAYWPGILGGDGNGHRWGVSNNGCGNNAPVSFNMPPKRRAAKAKAAKGPAAKQNSAVLRSAAGRRWLLSSPARLWRPRPRATRLPAVAGRLGARAVRPRR